MHRLPSFNEIIDKKTNASTPPLDIHKSNEARIIVAFTSLALGDHNKKYFFHKL